MNQSLESLKVIRDSIKIGKVVEIFEEEGKVRVQFEDKDNMVSGKIPFLSSEYDMPEIDDYLLMLFLPNGGIEGFVLGKWFSEKNPTPVADKNIYCKAFSESTRLTVGKKSGEVKLQGQTEAIILSNVVIEGNVTILGNLNVTGTITSS